MHVVATMHQPQHQQQQQNGTPSFPRPESGALPRPTATGASSPASIATQDETEVCYFTAKAVPIRASVVVTPSSPSSAFAAVPYQNPFVAAAQQQQSHFSVSTACASPPPPGASSASDSPLPQQYRAGSTLVTPSQFPPPPGHSHPSFVFRGPPSAGAGSSGSPLAMPSTSSSLVAVISPRASTASSQYPAYPPSLAGGRESTLSATPSLFPQPPSANGKEAYIQPLFLGSKDGSVAPAGRISALSTASSVPGPTPPPKEYHPTLSPMTYDYFSPLAPTVTSVQPSPPPVAPAKPEPSHPPAAAAVVGITRQTKPEPLALLSPQQQQQHTRSQSSSLLPPQPPRSHSPISPHSPVSNPALSPLTVQTLTHLSHTALRSPSLTFIDPPDSATGLRSPASPAGSSASPLTSAQRDRLWKLKQQYDEERGFEKTGGGEMSRWSMMTRRTQMDKEKRSMRLYLLLGLGLGLLALGGIVGIIVALTVAQKGGK